MSLLLLLEYVLVIGILVGIIYAVVQAVPMPLPPLHEREDVISIDPSHQIVETHKLVMPAIAYGIAVLIIFSFLGGLNVAPLRLR